MLIEPRTNDDLVSNHAATMSQNFEIKIKLGMQSVKVINSASKSPT